MDAKTKKLKKTAAFAVDALEAEYPDAICSLEYEKPYELLIATRLSAQCTDARVNLITPALFERFPTLEAFANAQVSEVEELVRSCGLYKTKARDIVAMCRMLIDEYGSIVPDTMEALTSLPGVGRKTANLMLGDVFGQPAVVCDTHCIRITGLIGLIQTKDAYKAEMRLRELLPMDRASDFCHRLVLHGRKVCVANRPDCAHCVIHPVCEYALAQRKKLTPDK